jgi:hypothetical protein
LERRQDTAYQSDQDGGFSGDCHDNSRHADNALAAWFVLTIKAFALSADDVGRAHI